MKRVLVTGGAGMLGRLVVPQLVEAGYTVRGMSRRANPGKDWKGNEWVQADLETGVGVAEIVQGVDVIVHTATGGYSHIQEIDVDGTKRLLDAARTAHVSHIVYISIVGVDKVEYALAKAKCEAESLIQQSGIPYSILRATQFHDLVNTMFQFLTKLPLIAFIPTDLPLQPIASEEVARRLVEIVQTGLSGRLPDMGGPKVYTSGELARIWLKQHGMQRFIIPLWLPGITARGIRKGGNTCPQQATGKISWESWLQRQLMN